MLYAFKYLAALAVLCVLTQITYGVFSWIFLSLFLLVLGAMIANVLEGTRTGSRLFRGRPGK